MCSCLGDGARSEQARVLEAPAEVVDERLDLQLLPGHAAQQLTRLEDASVAVDVLAQPLAQRGELARLDCSSRAGKSARSRAQSCADIRFPMV